MSKVDVTVKLAGTDENAVAILTRVDTALAEAGVSREDRAKFREEATSGDYGNLISVVYDWVNVET